MFIDRCQEAILLEHGPNDDGTTWAGKLPI